MPNLDDFMKTIVLTPCDRTILYDSLIVLRDEFSCDNKDVANLLDQLENKKGYIFTFSGRDKALLIRALKSVPDEFNIPELYQNALNYLEEKLNKRY